MDERDLRFSFTAHMFLALLAAVSAATVLVQSKYLAVACPLAVLLLPLGALLLRGYRRWRGFHYPRKMRRYLGGLQVVVVTGWGLSLVPGLFWGAMYFHIYDPWPFSLNQGPDSAYAREGLLRVLEFDPQAAVDQVYYKGYDIRDTDRYLRFRSCQPEVMARVVDRLQKKGVATPIPSFHLNTRLHWWFTASEAMTFDYWADDEMAVWLDRRACTFYVRAWSH